VVYNIWVIQFVENINFGHYKVKIIAHLRLFDNLDSNFEIWVFKTVGNKNSAKRTRTKYFGFFVEPIHLFKRCNALLGLAFVLLDFGMRMSRSLVVCGVRLFYLFFCLIATHNLNF